VTASPNTLFRKMMMSKPSPATAEEAASCSPAAPATAASSSTVADLERRLAQLESPPSAVAAAPALPSSASANSSKESLMVSINRCGYA
jgi:hypothetical protein